MKASTWSNLNRLALAFRSLGCKLEQNHRFWPEFRKSALPILLLHHAHINCLLPVSKDKSEKLLFDLILLKVLEMSSKLGLIWQKYQTEAYPLKRKIPKFHQNFKMKTELRIHAFKPIILCKIQFLDFSLVKNWIPIVVSRSWKAIWDRQTWSLITNAISVLKIVENNLFFLAYKTVIPVDKLGLYQVARKSL